MLVSTPGEFNSGGFVMTCDNRGKGFIDYALAIRSRLRIQAFRLCGDWYEADDLVQETLFAVYRRWPLLTRREELDGYTRTTLVRTFLSVRRRMRWRREVLQAAPPDQPQGFPDTADLRITLQAKLRKLPPRQRAVIALRFWKGCSIKQTASELGISPGTVASQTNKALTTLRTSVPELGR